MSETMLLLLGGASVLAITLGSQSSVLPRASVGAWPAPWPRFKPWTAPPAF